MQQISQSKKIKIKGKLKKIQTQNKYKRDRIIKPLIILPITKNKLMEKLHQIQLPNRTLVKKLE